MQHWAILSHLWESCHKWEMLGQNIIWKPFKTQRNWGGMGFSDNKKLQSTWHTVSSAIEECSFLQQWKMSHWRLWSILHFLKLWAKFRDHFNTEVGFPKFLYWVFCEINLVEKCLIPSSNLGPYFPYWYLRSSGGLLELHLTALDSFKTLDLT